MGDRHRPRRFHQANHREKLTKLEVDRRRVLSSAGEVGHGSDELHRVGAANGAQEGRHLLWTQALPVHAAVDFQVDPRLASAEAQIQHHLRHLLADHRELDSEAR